MMPAIDVLIAGAGLAGSRCAETLRAGGFGGRVVVVGDEPHAPYERPALSKEMLTGARAPAALALRADGFWRDRDIELRLGATLRGLDVSRRRAVLGDEPVRWRRLVLATGARPLRLGAVPAAENVHHLRGLDDAPGASGRPRTGWPPGDHRGGLRRSRGGVELSRAGGGRDDRRVAPAPFAEPSGPSVGRRLAESIGPRRTCAWAWA